MKPTTRTIDEIFLMAAQAIFNDGSREVINSNNTEVKQWAKLRTKQAKQQLLATILASMPEKNGTDTHEQDKGWNACLTQVEQAIKKIFESKEGK